MGSLTSEVEVDQKAAKLLEDALALMNDEGRHWIQGEYKDEIDYDEATGKTEYGYCSVGAIRWANNGSTAHEKRDSEYERAIAALAEDLGYASGSSPEGKVIEWNDGIAEDWSEVKAAFQKAIRRLRGK